MLGKLLKHEFGATYRLYLPVYLILLVLTPLLAFGFSLFQDTESLPLQMVSGLAMAGYIIALIAIAIASFIFIILRFYRSMTTDEAYLTFTLPAKTTSLITSKLIPAIIWQVVTTLLVILSIAGFTFILGVWNFNDIHNIIDIIVQSIPELESLSGSIILFFVLFIVTLFIGVITGTLQIYASIAMGQLMNSHRLLFSFLYYVVIYTIMQVLSVLFILPFEFMMESTSTSAILDTTNLMLLVSIIFQIVCAVVFYIMSSIAFKKKLNLE